MSSETLSTAVFKKDRQYTAVFEEQSFSSGAFRNAHRGHYERTGKKGKRDRFNGKDCVVKRVIQGAWTKAEWDQELKPQTMAAKMWRLFSATVMKKNIERKQMTGGSQPQVIRGSVKIGTSLLTTIPTTGEYVEVEEFLDGEYEKFTSNSGYDCNTAPLLSAFSHFTYVTSKSELLVCDLQGIAKAGGKGHVTYALTDPAVCSRKQDYGKADLGAFGIAAFFMSHRCNAVCERLGISSQKPPVSAAHAARLNRQADVTYVGQLGADAVAMNAFFKAREDLPTIEE